MSSRLLSCLVAASALSTACAAGGDFAACTVGSDCASGICNSDGTCADAETSAASSGSGAGGPASSSTDGTTTTSATTGSGGGAGGSNVCSPNDDGVVTRAEVPLAPGLHATFRATENATVDTAGAMNGDGSRTWDFTAMLSGDHDELVETQDPSGAWYAAQFAGATYTARLSDAASLLGVFKVIDTQLLLMGVVSPTETPPVTELAYDPPVVVLAFPISASSTWQTSSGVTGLADGVAAAYNETYQSSVDAHGQVVTPFGPFSVLRVRTNLTRTVGATVTVSHQFSFVAECFGTVATVNSQPDELMAEFTSASEIERLSP
jgi:hypothetical protein